MAIVCEAKQLLSQIRKLIDTQLPLWREPLSPILFKAQVTAALLRTATNPDVLLLQSEDAKSKTWYIRAASFCPGSLAPYVRM